MCRKLRKSNFLVLEKMCHSAFERKVRRKDEFIKRSHAFDEEIRNGCWGFQRVVRHGIKDGFVSLVPNAHKNRKRKSSNGLPQGVAIKPVKV